VSRPTLNVIRSLAETLEADPELLKRIMAKL
jgi:hypothetical protein